MGAHLSQAKRLKIVERKAQGYKNQEIADEYDISINTVGSIIRAFRKTKKTKNEQNKDQEIIERIETFNYETNLDDIAKTLYEWFKNSKKSGTALKVADRFFLAYRAHKGQADNVTNIQQTFISMAPEAQLTIIQQTPQWQELVRVVASLLETCGACPKVDELKKIMGAK